MQKRTVQCGIQTQPTAPFDAPRRFILNFLSKFTDLVTVLLLREDKKKKKTAKRVLR